MRVCVATGEDGSVEVSSRAKLMLVAELVDGEIRPLASRHNPALAARERRPTFVKACAEAGAEAVVAAHGSFCFPSAAEARRRGVRLLVADRGEPVNSVASARPAGLWEFMFSSVLALVERARGGRS